jgi:TPR repeat protein
MPIGFLILDGFIVWTVVAMFVDWYVGLRHSIYRLINAFSEWRYRRRVQKSAKHGGLKAQHKVADFYIGHDPDSPRDKVRAHAWYSIAVKQGDEAAEVKKEYLSEIMDPKQIAKAQNLSSELWQKYVVPFQKD